MQNSECVSLQSYTGKYCSLSPTNAFQLQGEISTSLGIIVDSLLANIWTNYQWTFKDQMVASHLFFPNISPFIWWICKSPRLSALSADPGDLQKSICHKNYFGKINVPITKTLDIGLCKNLRGIIQRIIFSLLSKPCHKIPRHAHCLFLAKKQVGLSP